MLAIGDAIIKLTQTPILAVVQQEDVGSSYAAVTQVAVLAAVSDIEAARYTATTQVPFLAVGSIGGRDDPRIRSWGFDLDGHKFYVLHLGREGTYVYDMLSGQWANWVTEGYRKTWDAEAGIMWNGIIIAGDNENGVLWQVNPDSMDDHDGYRQMKRIVTAIIAVRGRNTATLNDLDITASVGYPTSTIPLVKVRFSDDAGVTYTEMPECDVTLLPGDTTQEIAFRSLGSFGAPGRVIEVSDVGGMVRIDDADVDVSGKPYGAE